MKSFEALQKSYEKEIALAEKHKQNAADIKREMDALRGKVSNRKISALNFNGQEYDRFLRLLDADKKTVLEAVDLVLGSRNAQEVEREEGDSEQEENKI